MARAYGSTHGHTQHTMRSVWMVLLLGSWLFYGAHGHSMRLMDLLQSHGEGYCITNRPQPLGVASDAAPTGHASSNRQFVASIGAQLLWHAPLKVHNGLLACPATTGADNAIGRRPARAQRRVYARALPTQLVRGSPCPSAFNVPVAQQHGNRSLMPLTAHPSAGRRPQKTAPTRVARTAPTGDASGRTTGL